MANKFKILSAVNSFKESINTVEINNYICTKLSKYDIKKAPISDGGDGFLSVIKYYFNCDSKFYFIPHPLYSKKIKVEIIYNKDYIFIESAKVVGLHLLKQNERDVFKVNTYGLGVLLKKISNEPGFNNKTIIIGIGGTATNDFGLGMMKALLGKDEDDGINLLKLFELFDWQKSKSVKYSNKIIAIADVKNPLSGKQGAAYTYAIQKGCPDNLLPTLDLLAKKFERKVKKQFQKDISKKSMLGAGGGITAGLNIFLKAEVVHWSEFILNFKIFRDKYDIIITGEGKIDNQSFNGKVVGELLNKYSTSDFIIIAGKVDDKFEILNYNKRFVVIEQLVNYYKTKADSVLNPIFGLKKALINIEKFLSMYVNNNKTIKI